MNRVIAAVLLTVGLLLAFSQRPQSLPQNFPRAIERVLKHEGCTYENHPRDPGGPTKCGVTLADVRRFIKADATAADVRALTRAQAIWVYREKYAPSPGVRFDDLPSGLDYAVLDYGINSGVGRSGLKLCQALGLQNCTWKIADATIKEAKRRGVAATVDAVCAERRAFVRRIGTYDVFGVGWERRISDVCAYARNDAGARSIFPMPEIEAAPGKAYDPDDIDMLEAPQ